MKDFTIEKYKYLINALSKKYSFKTFAEYLSSPEDYTVILRHDIDLKKRSSLVFAEIENDYKIKGTYYFRAVKKIFDENIIARISTLGHEVGYHYEDLSLARGDLKAAYRSFEENLNRFRAICDIKTICMHGNSLSKYDNRFLWKNKNYKDEYNLLGEPYFDIDFDKVLYLTDSAQRWNGDNIALRDKVNSQLGKKYNFSTTDEIISNVSVLPKRIMFTIHPDRWTDNIIEWHRIDKVVKVKNFIKKNILKKRSFKLYEK